MTDQITKFQIGQIVSQSSACDHECIFSFEILDRTAKFVTIDVHGERRRRRIKVINGSEAFEPFGRYSMSPTVYATSAA